MPPKNLYLTITWMILASLLTLGAFWQAQIAITRDAEARHRLPPPPLKTRHAVRVAEMPWSGDVVADYIARCGKGMTDQEIRWIVEDFQNAGLEQGHPWEETNYPADTVSPPSPAELESLEIHAAAQQRWYRRTLVDGFRLSPEQSAQLNRSLTELRKKSQTEFIDILVHGFPPDPKRREGERDERWLSWSSFYFYRPEARPWKLCMFTSQQEKLTYKPYYDIRDDPKGDGRHDPSLPDMRLLSSAPPGLLFLLSSPDYDGGSKAGVPIFLDQAGAIFPYLAVQQFIPPSDNADPFAEIPDHFLENLRILHPAQLKTLLLFSPANAALILTALDGLPR